MLTAQWLHDNAKHLDPNITAQSNIWVAYSGGVDSHVLLDLARQSFDNVSAIHINHGLSALDDLWQQHCEAECANLNIAIKCIRVNAQPLPGQSPEDAARIARRVAWQMALQPNDYLLVAHHADDQTETVLYRLLRGAGPKGLGGIKPATKIGSATLLRPLLNVSKQQILDYATAHNLHYMQDQSNNDDHFDRNYIRNNLMPLITQRWPAAVANVNRAANICSSLVEVIEPVAKTALAELQVQPHVLQISKLLSHSQLWQNEILRSWLQQYDIYPSSQHLKIIYEQVVNARVDAMPQYSIANKILRRSQDQLYLLDLDAEQNLDFSMLWDLQQPLLLPNGMSLTVADIAADIKFIDKLRQYDVTVRLGNHGHKAKKVFQQFKVPPWERAKYPLLYANDRLVGVIGLWCSGRI